MPIVVLVSKRFMDRDRQGLWAQEIEEIVQLTRADVFEFHTNLEVYSYLSGKSGIIFAGSESNLNAHSTSHSIFRFAPKSFLKVTLQHGYECIGFLQNREQSMVHGEDIRFAADVLCGWMPEHYMQHLRPTERDKLIVTGPTACLAAGRQSARSGAPAPGVGIVCENLHSVRMNAAGDFKASYMDTFFAFAQRMNRAGRRVSLRPHPGGQYVIRNAVPLPEYVDLNNEPMYRVDLSGYAYGISAPSSVLIDMVMAGIPTAVWSDGTGMPDTSNYAGLTQISTLEEWQAFAEAAIADPDSFRKQQAAFLEQTGIVTDPDRVRQNFMDLLLSVGARPSPRRILFVANAEIPTLQISFFEPLKDLIEAGSVETCLITESEIRKRSGKQNQFSAVGREWLITEIKQFKPDVAIFCRYSGPNVDLMINQLREHNVPIIFHIDDDLLNVPIEIGKTKHFEHNKPERKEAISTLIRSSDLVYCSTPLLVDRFRNLGFDAHNMRSGKINCSANILVQASEGPVRKVGYMGFDHAHDFELLLPELVRFLRERIHVQFELFGSIPKPAELDEFGDRVTVIAPVRPYSAFRDAFAARRWDIGICPLAKTEFNQVKTNLKWVEYSAVGAAVIATSGTIYDDCCSDECGLLVDGSEGWYGALLALCDDPSLRFRMVRNAQNRIRRDYSEERLRLQILQMVELALSRAPAAVF